MSETKFTPGPWRYVASSEHHGPYVTTDSGTTVADCYVMSLPGIPKDGCWGDAGKPVPHMGEMADANARLIAAATDLYEALQSLLKPYTGIGSEHLSGCDLSTISNAFAALSKARGESHE